MRTIRVIIILSLLSSMAFGQTSLDDLHRVDGLWTKMGESSPFSGEFIEKFESGKTKGIGTFKDGLVEGERITYYENGNKAMERNYKKGDADGFAKEYFENGNVEQEGEFKGGKEIGIWTVYYETGEKYVTLNFENGVQHGDYMEYSKDGQLLRKLYFINGRASYSDDFIKYTEEALELSRQFKNEEAIKLYDKAIEINPTVAQAYFNRGACKGNNFDFEGAIKDYDKAIELNPNYMEAYGNRGNAKINMYTSTGILNLTPEQADSACKDFHKADELGDTSIGTEDLIFIHCKKYKKKKK